MIPVRWVRDLLEAKGTFSVTPSPRINILLGQDRFDEADTLIHEIMHAIWYQRGLQDSDTEERIVAAMASGFAEVLARNPDVRRYLSGRW